MLLSLKQKYNKKLSLRNKEKLTGWFFLAPATLLIVFMSFVPMLQSIMLSFYGIKGAEQSFVGFHNYQRMFSDKVFLQSVGNTFFYLICQVPIMLLFAIVLAVMLNNKKLKFKGVFRTAVFLPCATSLVSYAIIFNVLFATDGLINTLLLNLGWIDHNINFFNDPTLSRMIIILGLVWRWTGYNMVFFLAALQNIDDSIYEAALIDGASNLQKFFKITVPLLKPTILLTAIMSTTGTLQLFDESVNLTAGGPANSTITISHYIYNTSFKFNPNFGYAATMSVFILIATATFSMIQMKAGDKRE